MGSRMRSIEWWHCRWPWVTPRRPQLPQFVHFRAAIHSFATGEPRDFKFGTLIYHSKSHPANEKNFPERGVVRVRWPVLEFCTPSECSLSGRGQGHVNNFYIVDLENFATASRRYTGDTHNSVRSRFVYGTYKTMEATRSRHGWVHMFITHWPTVTFQLHSFDLWGLVVQVVSALFRGNWQDFNLHDASRGHSAIAELLVQL